MVQVDEVVHGWLLEAFGSSRRDLGVWWQGKYCMPVHVIFLASRLDHACMDRGVASDVRHRGGFSAAYSSTVHRHVEALG